MIRISQSLNSCIEDDKRIFLNLIIYDTIDLQVFGLFHPRELYLSILLIKKF